MNGRTPQSSPPSRSSLILSPLNYYLDQEIKGLHSLRVFHRLTPATVWLVEALRSTLHATLTEAVTEGGDLSSGLEASKLG